MFFKHCNIDKTDRINRAVIGVVIFLAAWTGFGRYFFMIAGLILVIEGIIGWCYIPVLVEKIKNYLSK